MCSMSSTLFYGKQTQTGLFPMIRNTNNEHEEEKPIEKYPFKLLSVENPSSTWKIFRKQNDALQEAQRRKNGVMTFVYQSGTGGERRFLVAHPSVFWFYDCRRKGQRCSYEVIAEHALCKLYFDLEFCKDSNPHHDGIRMTETFIKVVTFFLLQHWNVKCTRDNVLELDSSTENKFSCHLIFQLPGFFFQDNYHVGNFVKTVCNDLRTIKSSNQDSVLSIVKMGISFSEFLELFVHNKGKEQLFCDEGVYTKNRHFRLYCSTKWNRKAPLIRSGENKWLSTCQSSDEIIFLDSLITYIPVDKNHSILQFFNSQSVHRDTGLCRNYNNMFCPFDGKNTSPYPDVDSFIHHLVAPGRVYRWYYSSSKNLLNYDIIGNRFCHNIGREHRSNNIRFIVDINKKYFYQKCYDPDCRGFSSEYMSLPTKLVFILEEPISFDNSENDSLWDNHLPEEQLGEVLDCIESTIAFKDNGEFQ